MATELRVYAARQTLAADTDFFRLEKTDNNTVPAPKIPAINVPVVILAAIHPIIPVIFAPAEPVLQAALNHFIPDVLASAERRTALVSSAEAETTEQLPHIAWRKVECATQPRAK